MKKQNIIGVILTLVMILFLFSCSNNSNDDGTNQSENIGVSTNVGDDLEIEQEYTGKIFLYGEEHGVDEIIDKEYELWFEYYHEQGMRHLFIESPYYTAEFLNLWMSSDNDDILVELYADWMGSAKHNPKYKEFYEKIKIECPETIFHGTDVGHQYESIGQRYLDYLTNNNLFDSESYKIAKEVAEQGEQFSNSNSSVYRENMMVENFIRELETLTNENIMGIYGSAHTGIENLDNSNSIPCMANQLNKIYVGHIYSESLANLATAVEPERIDIIEINGKDYEALYYGKRDMNFTNEFQYREFWRLENAYDDFENNLTTMQILPDSNYPMLIEIGQVFVIDYTKTDGSVERKYYRLDGFVWEGMLSSEEFVLHEIQKLTEPVRIGTIDIAGKNYKASYYGKNDMKGLLGCESIEFWRLEEAYADFKDSPLDGAALPYTFYPFTIETGQVFVIDLVLIDGSSKRGFFRSNGNEWRSKLSTEGFIAED